jgi:N utilization substance protein B
MAFQALYAWDASRAPLQQLLTFDWLDEEKRVAMDMEMGTFSRLLIAGTLENIDAIDDLIRRNLSSWSFERLKKVDLAILRISVYSLMYQDDMPAGITIDEAIEIAKEYGTDDSYKFINGVLDAIRKNQTGVDAP